MTPLRPQATNQAPVGTYFVSIEHLRPDFEVRSIDRPNLSTYQVRT